MERQYRPGASYGSSADHSHASTPGKRTLTEALVQRRADDAAGSDPAQVQAAAQRGISGGAQRLPHLDLVQRSFGRHDVSGVQAHLGAEATAGSHAMGAQAFATGDHVAFAGTPDLHTVAHEAAHVVQQRAGIHLKGGVGEEGDEHERHADAVADQVVAGRSAEALLDRYAPGGAPAAGVQGKAVQRAVKARKLGEQEFKSFTTLAGLLGQFELDDAGKRAFGAQMKTRMFATAVFPATYRAEFDTNPHVKEEVSKVILGLDDLINASGSQTVISASPNQGTEVADQLFAIIGAGITAPYVAAKCPHFEMVNLGLAGQSGTDYLTFIRTTRAKLREYESAIQHVRHDKAESDKNAQMANRIEVLKADAEALETQLKAALTAGHNTAPLIAKMNDLRTNMAVVEKAMDLELRIGQDDIQEKLRQITTDPTEHNSYANGGADDGMAVDEAFSNGLACSLYALLALVPGFMGANNPRELHAILRKTKTLKQYDNDPIVAQVRFAAGLRPTMRAGARLDTIITGILNAGGARPSFIADPTGEAHTFAVVWKDGAYRPRDNEADADTDIMNVSAWKQIEIGTTWML